MILFARSPKGKLLRRLRRLHDRYYEAPSTEIATVAAYLETLAELRDIETPRRPRGPRIHLGCGEHRIRGWINADLAFTGAQDLLADLGQALPFRNESAQFIHSEDLLEHMDLAQGLALLRECYRVLRPGGVMRLLTPDAAAIVEHIYLRPEKRHLRWCDRELGAGSRVEALNMHFRMNGEHRFIYDFDYLRHVLSEIGFSVRRVRWNDSAYRELRFLDLRNFGLNLFVEAEKRAT
ncbi:MAG TPA: methyltransferase domain-containing protein [Thermoanaerobaculia bacterium]|nr:methyltransferase domain-containing protein [Thermoanaerobaculia bacterium]